MGKGAKPSMPLPAYKKTGAAGGDATTKKGCNSPMGCLVNIDPPINCSRNPDYVKVICDNSKCPRNQYLHKQCYEFWESKIIMGVQKSQSRTRDWTDDQVRRRMWSRVWDVAFRHCKCVCGGYLKRADVLELAEQPEPQADAAAGGGPPREEPPKKKKQPAAPKNPPLPKLVQTTKNTYTNKTVSPWTAAGGSSTNAGAAAASKLNYAAYKSLNNSMESLLTSESNPTGQDYIPGLFVNQAKEKTVPKPQQRRVSTSSNDNEDKGVSNDINKRNSVTSPMTSPFRFSHSPASTLPEEKDDEEDWHVVFNKGRKEKRDSLGSSSEGGTRATSTTGNRPIDDEYIDDGPSTSGVTPPNGTSAYDEYKSCLDAHSRLNEPNAPFIYGRDLFEIKSLLEEMNAMLNP